MFSSDLICTVLIGRSDFDQSVTCKFWNLSGLLCFCRVCPENFPAKGVKILPIPYKTMRKSPRCAYVSGKGAIYLPGSVVPCRRMAAPSLPVTPRSQDRTVEFCSMAVNVYSLLLPRPSTQPIASDIQVTCHESVIDDEYRLCETVVNPPLNFYQKKVTVMLQNEVYKQRRSILFTWMLK